MQLTAKDGHKIYVYCWDNVEKPRAILQIFHGMCEHAGRYERFARILNEQEIIVYGNDHRGHGKTGLLNGKLGYIGEDGFNRIVEDEAMITNYLKQRYPNIPIYVFSHSFGSFIAQEYLTKYSKAIAGIILCGSAAQTGIKYKFAKRMASIYKKIFGEEKEAKVLEKIAFLNYNKRIANTKRYSWLSCDEAEVDKYEADSLCGFTCTANFFYYLSDGLTKLYQKEKLNRIRKSIPIFIIAGREDPVGEYGKRVIKLYQIYNRIGISDVKISLYEGARHELLNERNKEQVTLDISQWLDSHIIKMKQ